MSWPPFRLEQWQLTRDTVHLWTLIVGKTPSAWNHGRTAGGTQRSTSLPAA